MIVYRELSSLEADLGFSARALYGASTHLSGHYRKAQIPKGNGEMRELYVPDAFLKSIQRAIAQKLLVLEPVSSYACAYRPGGSTLANARPHAGKPLLLKLDIRHFFDRLIYPLVKEKAFPAARYSEANRVLLSLLCTYRDVLPQGAPTSPAISNIVMREFDDAVGVFCKERGITYTRYCDDMTFSGDFDPKEVTKKVQAELGTLHLFLNEKKTVILRNGQKKAVTGIVVNEKPAAPAAYRKKLRQEIYYCKKFGVESHLAKSAIDGDVSACLNRLLGQVNYVLQIDPTNGEMQEYKSWLLSEKKRLRS